MAAHKVDVAVIGTGPGGYVAAIRCAQLGLSVAAVEDDRPGGVCLNWGCIPTKALLRNAEVVHLLERASEFGIRVQGFQADYAEAVKRSRQVADRMAKGVEFLFRKNKITLLPGTGTLRSPASVEVKGVRGAETIEARALILATGSEPKALPGVGIDEKIVLSSNGAVRQERAPKSLVIIGAGAVGVEFADVYASYGTQVTILEALPRLVPVEDEEVSSQLARSFNRRGMTLKTMAEGVVAAETIAGREPRPIDYTNVPSCTYCRPQIASIGLTEARAKENGREITVGRFPFTASGKAVALGETEGFIKVVADKATGELLGAHIVGPDATEVIHEFAVGRTLEATLEEIVHTIHAHPTLSEAALEAALGALGQAIHI